MTNHEDRFRQYQPAGDALQNQTLFITGAAQGLGRALAKKCAELGAELILLDRSERGLNAASDEIDEQFGRQPALYPLDLAGASAGEYQELTDIVSGEFDKLDALIHCAAHLGQLSPLANFADGEWQKTFQTNLHGPLMLTRELLPVLACSESANIIFTYDERKSAYWGAYAASKAALLNVASVLADELDSTLNGTNQIRCNTVNPGPMQTSLRASAYPGEDPAGNPLPTERLAAYLYLLCREAHSINGQLLDYTE